MKKFTFTGTGSAFNNTLGNTACYKFNSRKTSMILIDCGDKTFSKMKPILEENRNIINFTICITHIHADHVATLPTLLYYIYYVYRTYSKSKITVNIITHPDNYGYLRKSIGEDFINEIEYNELDKYPPLDLHLDPKNAERIMHKSKDGFRVPGFNNLEIFLKDNPYHVQWTKPVYIYFNDMKDDIYEIYAGDTTNFPPALCNEGWRNCKRVYIDCSEKGNPVHISVHEIYKATLNTIIKPEIVAMHFDNDNAIKKAREYGFAIATVEKG